MLGAIVGDIAGSVYEFADEPVPEAYDLFQPGCGWTDDTLLTVAVADAVMATMPDTTAAQATAAAIFWARTEGLAPSKKEGLKDPVERRFGYLLPRVG